MSFNYKITISKRDFDEIVANKTKSKGLTFFPLLYLLLKFKIIVINKNLGKQFILQGDFIKYFEKKINDHENLEFKIQPKNYVYSETTRASKLPVETYL